MNSPEFRFLNAPRDIQEAAWVTARKAEGREFTPALFYRYLVAEHSPIRRLVLAWRFRAFSKRASSHLVRHVMSQPYIGGTRPDWFPDLKDPEAVDHLQDSNCQALLAIGRERLCFNAWKGTREAIVALKAALMAADASRVGPGGDAAPGFYRSLGQAMVPKCVYRCGCPEDALGRGCGWWKGFAAAAPDGVLPDIRSRYILYNDLFDKENRG